MYRIACSVVLSCVMLAIALAAHAVMPPPRDPYVAPTTLPAEIHGLRYIVGIRAIDDNPQTPEYQPKVWAELTKKDFSIRRQRIDQRTLNKKARKLEKIDLMRVPYKRIQEVWYGDDALRKLAVTKLPTVPRNIWDIRSRTYMPLEFALDQRHRAPVVVIYKAGRKERGAVIVMGSREKNAALYGLLKRQIFSKRKK